MPVLDALSDCIPVITLIVSSPPEIIGESTLLIYPFQTEEIAQALCDIYSNGDLRRNLAAAGLERSKLFSWEKCAAETMQTYEKALAM